MKHIIEGLLEFTVLTLFVGMLIIWAAIFTGAA